MEMENEFVNGDGFISDESSSLGDDDVKSVLEQKTKRKLNLPYNAFPEVVKKSLKLDRKQVVNKHENVLDFYKTRPQITTLEKAASNNRNTVELRTGRPPKDVEAEDLLYNDSLKGDPSVWQQSETIDAFLKRLPVGDPETARVGPWLWVKSAQTNSTWKKQREKQNVDAFIDVGVDLLEDHLKRRSRIEAENPDKAPSTITRYMQPHKAQLEDDLLRAAVDNGTTCGKWMLFPVAADLPRYWRVVAEATSQGKLGPLSKVATCDPYNVKDATLICVYTYDFADLDDVRRVLDGLLDLNLCSRDGKPIYYKCDAYTYLNITSENQYKLRASLFSSKEVFGNEAKVLQDGPVARLKKRNRATDSFLST